MARGIWKNREDTWSGLAKAVLKEKKKPMRFQELCDEILKRKKNPFGETPRKSIYSALFYSKEIIHTKDGKYKLRE